MQILDSNFKKFSSTTGDFSHLKKSSVLCKTNMQKNKENSVMTSTLKKKKMKNNFIK